MIKMFIVFYSVLFVNEIYHPTQSTDQTVKLHHSWMLEHIAYIYPISLSHHQQQQQQAAAAATLRQLHLICHLV